MRVGYHTLMNTLLELSPLIAFFAVFELFGIYWASAALMVACVLVLVIHRRSTGKYRRMHVITAVVAVVLGGATLALHDARFIQWKPTVLLGVAALAFLGSSVIGERPLARRLLEDVFPEPLEVSAQAWLVLNALWAVWFALLAGLNLYVARNFSESTWVHFKFFGITAALFVFMIPQVFWLNGRTKPAPATSI